MNTNQERISFGETRALLWNAALAVANFEREHSQVTIQCEQLLDRCSGCDCLMRDWAEELAETINAFSKLRGDLSTDLHALQALAGTVQDGTSADQEVAAAVATLAGGLEDLASHSAEIVQGLFGLTREVAGRAESSED